MGDSRKMAAAALVVLLGGNASNLITIFDSLDHRDDSFTSSDGLRLERRVMDAVRVYDDENDTALLQLRERMLTTELKLQECVRYHP